MCFVDVDEDAVERSAVDVVAAKDAAIDGGIAGGVILSGAWGSDIDIDLAVNQGGDILRSAVTRGRGVAEAAAIDVASNSAVEDINGSGVGIISAHVGECAAAVDISANGGTLLV